MHARACIRSLAPSSGGAWPRRPAARRRESRPPAPKPPTWQDQLQRIIRHTTHLHRQTGAHAVHRPADAPRRAWYVWNIDMSLEAGGLVLEYYHQERRQNGTFGTIKAQGVARDDVSAYEDPADQRLFDLSTGSRRPMTDRSASHSPYGHRDHRGSAPVWWRRCLYDLLLPELCATGGCFG